MENDLIELLRMFIQRYLQILLPEEFGVGEAGGEDALVAGDDRRAAVIGVDIGDADEVRARARTACAALTSLLVRRRNISGWCAW